MSQDRLDAQRPAERQESEAGPPVLAGGDASRIAVPGGVAVLHAEFARRGADLIIGDPDTPALVILDYFVGDAPPDLVTDGGGILTGRSVAKLAGPDQLAPSPDAAEAAPIGQVEQVDGEVVIVRADGSRVIADEGTPVFQDDVVTTDAEGAVGLRMIDGMTLSLGSDARMVLDEFAYDPAADAGGGVIEIIQGAFSFVSGKAAHVGLDSLVIDTPTMTIGIRGTKVVANAAAEGETTSVALLPEDDGTIGKIMISTEAGEELLEDAYVATQVTSRFLPPAPQSVVTPDWITAKFSKPLAFLPPDSPVDPRPVRTPVDRTEIEPPDRPHEEAALDEQLAPRAWSAQGAELRPTTGSIDNGALAPERTGLAAPAEPAGSAAAVPLAVGPLQETASATLVMTGSEGVAAASATPFNQPPEVVASLEPAAVREDLAFSYDAAAAFADGDAGAGDSLTFSAAESGGGPLPAWLTIDPSSGTLSGTPGNGDVGGLTVVVTARDEAGASATSSLEITVSNTNDVPVVVTSIGDTPAAEDAAFSYDVSGSFTDVDAGDSLSFSATLSGGAPLPAWLSIDPSTGVLSGIPLNAHVGGLTIDVTATDGSGASATSSFQLSVTNTNDLPVVVTPIVGSITAEDVVFSYNVSGSFADVDVGDSLTYSATLPAGAPLPAWLTIDPATGVLSGTPLNADVDVLTVDVTATDGSGASATSSFQLTVTNTNDAPVAVTPIADVTPDIGLLFSYDASAHFADDDVIHGDSLAYSAQLVGALPLPPWLAIDPATGVLSGTPALPALGIPLDIEVTATDGAGASVTTSFRLTPDSTNSAPVLSSAASPALTTIVADSTDPAGDTVAQIFADGSITDADGSAVEAMALTGVDASNGTWEYSLDDGVNWSPVGAVADDAALLLDASARLRFVPDPGFVGTADITFRAWDMTVGANGDSGVDVSTNGGSTPYSATSDQAVVMVNSGRPDLSSGTEFQVTTAVNKEQQDSDVAALSDGGFVVVWQSKDQDGDNWGVYGQRYDAAGNATGSEFRVNTMTAKEQESPAVGALDGGGFVVVWQSKDQDGDDWGIYGQRYDSAGTAAGGEFQVSTVTAKEQMSASVGTLDGGGFVVVWQSKDQDGDNWGIHGQRFDSSGAAVGGEFQVNTMTAKEQENPSIAGLGDGGFVVTWQSKDQDGDNWGVFGQRYDAAGNATGAEFQVNTTTAKEQENPSVAALTDGGFVVTWQSWEQDGDQYGIYGQRFDAAGNPVEFEFQVNEVFDKHQQDPNVVGLPDGGFLVTWQSKDQDGDTWGIYGRHFDADGDALGAEFAINTTLTDAQTDPALAVSDDGGLFASWTSPDANDTGVFGHLYQSETASVTVNPPSMAASSMLEFGSLNSFVDAGDPGAGAAALDPGTGDFTVEAWFYYAGPNGTQTIVSKGNSSSNEAGFNIFLDGSELVIRIATSDGTGVAASSITLPAGPGWHHVAMSVDQEAGVGASSVTGYLDGSSAGWTPGHGAVAGATFTTTSTGIDTGASFLIGAVDDGVLPGDHFGAEIADVRVWSTARSAADLQADLGRTLNGDEDHLLANWKLDDGLGATAQDSGAGGFDGTLIGAPVWEATDLLSVVQNGLLAGRISASDPEGDTLSYAVGTGATNGIAAIDPQTGTWTYTPGPDYTGADSFSYQVSDGNGGTDTVSIAVTVTP